MRHMEPSIVNLFKSVAWNLLTGFINYGERKTKTKDSDTMSKTNFVSGLEWTVDAWWKKH